LIPTAAAESTVLSNHQQQQQQHYLDGGGTSAAGRGGDTARSVPTGRPARRSAQAAAALWKDYLVGDDDAGPLVVDAPYHKTHQVVNWHFAMYDHHIHLRC
jgi:hypothetical protein